MDAKKWFGISIVILSLFGCGGGGDSGGSTNPSTQPDVIIAGKVIISASEMSITVHEINGTIILAETTVEDNIDFNLKVEGKHIKKDNYFILTVTNLENNLTLRSVIDTDDLIASSGSFSSKLTTVSSYSEASLVLAEFAQEEDISSYVLNLLIENSEGVPQPTSNKAVNELASRIDVLLKSITDQNDSAYRAEIYAKTLELLWPTVLKSESTAKILLPSSSEWSNIQTDIISYDGVNVASFSNNMLNIETGQPATGDFTIEILADGVDPFRVKFSSIIAISKEIVSQTIPAGSIEAISIGNLSLIPSTGSFINPTNITINELSQLPDGWADGLTDSFFVEIDDEPIDPIIVNWKLLISQSPDAIRLVHFDPESKETNFIHPISYNEIDNSVDFSVPSFSPFGIFDDKPTYTFKDPITLKMIESDPNGIFKYIRNEVIAYLEDPQRIKNLQTATSANFSNSDEEIEYVAEYFLRLASKALVSFMLLSETDENISALEKLEVNYGFFEPSRNALEEYRSLQMRIRSLSIALNMLKHPYITYHQLNTYAEEKEQTMFDNMNFSIYSNNSSHSYYIATSAHRLSLIGRQDIDLFIKKLKTKVSQLSPYGENISLECEKNVQKMDEVLAFSFLESPKIRTNNFDNWDEVKKLQNLKTAKFLVELVGDVGNSNSLIETEIKLIEGAADLMDNWKSIAIITKDKSYFNRVALEVEDNSCVSVGCLGATKNTRWIDYVFDGDDYRIPLDIYEKLTKIEEGKKYFEKCNFQNFSNFTIDDDYTFPPRGAYVSPENPTDPIETIQLEINLVVTGEAKIGESINFDASGTSVSPQNTRTSYNWQIFKPNNSNASLSPSNTVTTSLTPDVYGSYTVKLTVTADNVVTTKSYSFTVNESVTQDIVDGNPQYILGTSTRGTYGPKGYSKAWDFDVDIDVTEIIVWAFRDSKKDDGLGIALSNGKTPKTKCITTDQGSEICSWDKYDFVADKQGGKEEVITVNNPDAGTYYIGAYGFEAFDNNRIYFELKRDLDKDNDGVPNSQDWAPLDSSEAYDSDGDGVGDNADAFPNDKAASIDADNDGQPDVWHSGHSEGTSFTGLHLDVAPGITSYVQNAGLITIDGQIYILPLGGEGASFSLIGNPQHGQVELSNDHWLYTPNAGYQGDDSFVYQAIEADGAIKQMYVSLTVSNNSGGHNIGDLSFNDINLKTCVDETAQSFGWTLVSDITELSCNSKDITDLVGIEQLISLTGLELSGNQLSDISALSGLTSLAWLGLSDNRLSDISALSGLTSLTELRLWGNQLSDISALSGLTSLIWLELGGNQLSDISVLSGLTSLIWLELGGNQLSDISALSGLTSLTELGLWDNQVSDISALSGSTSLIWLELGGNQLSDISVLSGLTSLIWLELGGNQLSDISALSGFTSLTELGLWDNQLSDISALSGLTLLTKLGLGGNQFSDISALYNLSTLSTLELSSNQNLLCSAIDALQATLPNTSISRVGCNSGGQPQAINIVATWDYTLTYDACPNLSEEGTATWTYHNDGYSLSTYTSNQIDPRSCSFIGSDNSDDGGNHYPASNPITPAEFESGLNDYNNNYSWFNTQFESENRISLTGTVINTYSATIIFIR